MSKFSSMSDMRKGNDNGDKDKKDKQGNNLYTGGTVSGLNVIGRPTHDDEDDDDDDVDEGKGDVVKKIFRQKGVGVEGATGSVVIRFFRNGFTVGDGELRRLDDPANRQFLEAMNRGVLPAELGSHADLDVSVEDHRSEDYVAPPYRPFSGAGATIGGTAAAPRSAVAAGKLSGALPTVNASEPTTVIAVKLVDGRRERVTLNLSHTVGDLQSIVAGFAATGGRSFILSGGFPPKPLGDAALTIAAAGLKGAAVTQALA